MGREKSVRVAINDQPHALRLRSWPWRGMNDQRLMVGANPAESHDSQYDRGAYRANAMQAISANDLKTRGVGAIAEALQQQSEVAVSVRGELRYVVMHAAHYQRLRDYELEVALSETRADLAAGRFVAESVDAHLERIETMAAAEEENEAT